MTAFPAKLRSHLSHASSPVRAARHPGHRRRAAAGITAALASATGFAIAVAIAAATATPADAAPRGISSASIVSLPLGRSLGVLGVGDVDGDGRDDLVLEGAFASRDATLRIVRAPVEGSVNEDARTTLIHLPSTAGLSAVAIGDVDGDGVDDIVMALVNAAVTRTTDRHHVHVVLGQPDWPAEMSSHDGLRFTRDVERARAGRAAGTEHIGLAIADMNGDGRNDFVLGVDTPQSRSSTVEIVFNTGAWNAAQELVPDVVVDGLGRCQQGLGDVGDVTGDGRPDLLVRRCATDGVPEMPDLVAGRDTWPAELVTRMPVPETPPDSPPPPPRAGGYVVGVVGSSPQPFAPQPLLVARDLDGDGVGDVVFEFGTRAFVWRGSADAEQLGARLRAGASDRAITGADFAGMSMSHAWKPMDFDGDGTTDVVLGQSPPPATVSGDARVGLPLQTGDPEEMPPVKPTVVLFRGTPRGAVIAPERADRSLTRPGTALWAVGDFDGDGIGDLLVGTAPNRVMVGLHLELLLGPVTDAEASVAPAP